MKFKENLKALRKQVNLTQPELAEKLKIHFRTVQNYEMGTREPNLDMLVEIADFFDVSLDVLIGRNFPK